MEEHGYTPELLESDVGLGRPVLYEEPGAKKSYPGGNALAPCASCGALVIAGQLEDGTRLAVEQETLTYVLSWRQKVVKKGQVEPPTLTQSRGYPVHTCRGHSWDTHGVRHG
jgi:hypothetical protein